MKPLPSDRNKEEELKKTLRPKAARGKEPTAKERLNEKLLLDALSDLSMTTVQSKKKAAGSDFQPLTKIINYITRFMSNHKFFAGMNCDSGCPAICLERGHIVPSLEAWSTQHIYGWRSHFKLAEKFRREGIDFSHISTAEFTMFNFYTDFNYTELMDLTEQMISGMIKDLLGSYRIDSYANGIDKDPVQTNFRPPFRRMNMMEELEKITNLKIPKDLSSEETTRYLIDACTQCGIHCLLLMTTARLLEKLVRHFLEETCINPTFIVDYPEIMSPLAKCHTLQPGFTQSFKLFINKHEVCTGHAVLNDHVLYRERSLKEKGCRSYDDELMHLFESFGMAAEYGLPPNGLWHLGIDRLLLLLPDWAMLKELDSYRRSQRSSKGKNRHKKGKTSGQQ